MDINTFIFKMTESAVYLYFFFQIITLSSTTITTKRKASTTPMTHNKLPDFFEQATNQQNINYYMV